MSKHEICRTVISLENEIEFLKEIKLPYLKKKRELNLLYKKLNNMSNLDKGETI